MMKWAGLCVRSGKTTLLSCIRLLLAPAAALVFLAAATNQDIGDPASSALPAGPRQPAPAPDPGAFKAGEDSSARMTVPVMINGQGPFRFTVDTGAARSAISRELADRLGLTPSSAVQVHTLTGLEPAASVLIHELQVSQGKMVRDVTAPSLRASDLGADGLLGVDALAGQQLTVDFTSQVMTLSPSRKGAPLQPPADKDPADKDNDTIVITARSRLGQLILVDSEIGNEPIYVVLDTGAQFTIGNSALRWVIARSGASGATTPISLVGVTGKSIRAETTYIDKTRIGGVEIRHAPIAYADAHPFDQFGLARKPSMLLGMDVLHKFKRISIDFPNRRISFVVPKPEPGAIGAP